MDNPPTSLSQHSGSEEGGGPSRPSLLFVDDDATMRRLMTARFERLGAQVETVAGARAALTFLEGHRPDLIISDAVMPGTDGFALCAQLKANPLFESIPFVILTAVTRDLRQRSLQAGADDYLSKLEHEVVLRLRIRLALDLGARLAAAGGLPPPPVPTALLVVSASAAVQDQMASHLSEGGALVAGVSSLGEALYQLETGAPDLLAVDLALGPGDLGEWLPQARAACRNASLPILVLAGKEEDGLLAPLEAQIQDRLTKPLGGPECRHRVKLLARISRL